MSIFVSIMTTKITLRNMRFYSRHGCYATEQKVGTRFTVDLTIYYDAQKAAETDDVSQAVNYLELYKCVENEMNIASHILENVTYRTLNSLGQTFPAINRAEICVSKISPPLGGDIEQVSVTMERNFR